MDIAALVIVSLVFILACYTASAASEAREIAKDTLRRVDRIDSLERGTNDRVIDLHRRWSKPDRAEGRQ